MMDNLNCPICEIEIYSEAGLGCMMCGMPLDDNDIDFCCNECEIKYKEVNKK